MTVITQETIETAARELDPPRFAHAFPEGSNVALCGTTRKGKPYTGQTRRCPDCEAAARPQFISR